MSQELRTRSQAQQLYVRALSSAYRNSTQLFDPSVWLARDPEAEEKMLRDHDIGAAVNYRRTLIAGKRWNMTPRIERSARAPMATAVARQLVEEIRNFAGARHALARAFFSGARFAKIHGATRVAKFGDGKERIWWVPTRLEDVAKRMFRVVPQERDGKITAHWERWDLAKQDWCHLPVSDWVRTIRHVYQDDQGSLGYGRALRECLGWIWWSKDNVMQDSNNAAERFGQGLLVTKVAGARDAATGMPNDKLIDAYIDALDRMRGRHVVVIDQEDDIQVVDGSAAGWELLNALRAEARSIVWTLVCGANLTTSANEGGSYALAQVQENSTASLIEYDREILQETLTDQLVRCLWYENWANMVELGIQDEPPKFSIVQERARDPQERSDVATKLSAMGVQLGLDDVLEQTGFARPEPGEPVIEPRQPSAQDGLGGLESLLSGQKP